MVQKETLESNGLGPILICFLTGPVTLGKHLPSLSFSFLFYQMGMVLALTSLG